jgi:hypothetical protein
MEALFNAVCDTLPANIWSPTTGALKAAGTRLLSWRDDSLVGLAALAREYTGCGQALLRRWYEAHGGWVELRVQAACNVHVFPAVPMLWAAGGCWCMRMSGVARRPGRARAPCS